MAADNNRVDITTASCWIPGSRRGPGPYKPSRPIKQAIALEHELIAKESKCSGFRKLWENAIGDLRLSITRKVDTFKETTDVFDEQSREFKSVMKSALDLCRNA